MPIRLIPLQIIFLGTLQPVSLQFLTLLSVAKAERIIRLPVSHRVKESTQLSPGTILLETKLPSNRNKIANIHRQVYIYDDFRS